MASRVHITFSGNAGLVVRQTLNTLAISDRVVALPDDLGFGPIDPLSVDSRAEFERTELGGHVDVARLDQVGTFWDTAAERDTEHVVWLSRRCVRELAGCMEWLSRCEEPPLALVIDGIDELKPAPLSIGSCDPDRLVKARILDRVARMEQSRFQTDRARWALLKQQNAPLRILDDNGLRSARITYFDSMLVECVPGEWTTAVRVIGDAIVWLVQDDPYHQCGDNFLIARLFRLIGEGRLEAEGDLRTLRDTRVRKHRG